MKRLPHSTPVFLSLVGLEIVGMSFISFWLEARHSHDAGLLLVKKICITFWWEARHSNDAGLLLVRDI